MAGMDYASLFDFILKAIYYQRCTQYLNVASLVFLLIDYLDTLPSEASLVWPKEWSIVKALFLLSRYLPFVYAPLTLYVGLGSSPSIKTCAKTFGASSVLIVVSMMLGEAIMFIRLYALSARSRRVKSWLIFQFAVVSVVSLTMFSLFVKSVKFMSSPVASVPGCLPRSFDSQKLLTVFGMVVASQLLIVIMSTVVTYLHYQTSESPLLTVFYRDGFFYFVSLSLVTVGNIIFNRVGPPELMFLFTLPQGVLHSILSCRLILHIYEFSQRDVSGRSSTLNTKTGMDFAAGPGSSKASQIGSEFSMSLDVDIDDVALSVEIEKDVDAMFKAAETKNGRGGDFMIEVESRTPHQRRSIQIYS